MILKISKKEFVTTSNPNIVLGEAFPIFSELPELSKKIIALYYDYESPYAKLSSEKKLAKIADYLETDEETVSGVLSENKEAALDYCSKQEDPIREMFITLHEQSVKLSRDMRMMNIQIGKTSGEDKSFEHYISWNSKVNELAMNYEKIRDKCMPDYEKELSEEVNSEKQETESGDKLTQFFRKKA